ncbi:MAG: FecR domain-containing protein [Methylacidiphilales bacterium]|nr:FecR domain-containing protein [Candidatus Methylacidiphilales bacterium]
MKSLILVLSLVVALTPPTFAATPAPVKLAEYKRADANFYWKGDVLKVEPNAVIVPVGGYTQQNDSYFITGRKKGPNVIYAQVLKDWIEPITPPNATSLGIPANVMQIREPQGDVQVAFPSAPATFLPVQDGMTVENGSVVKTGADGTAAIVFGGVASARLIPNSAAAVQQMVVPGLRSTEIDLTRGAVFSKVGKPIGEKEDYTIHTPFGIAAARGTDFVSVALPSRTDVWIAQGTVQLNQTNGAVVGQISADGAGPLKIIRFPLMPGARDAMMADAETMTAAINFIPMANQKIKALRDRLARGEKLSDAEMHYLSLIKKVPCLIKLALVTPPAPPPPPAVPPPAPLPLPATPAVQLPTPPPPAPSPVPAKPAVPAASAPAVTATPSATSTPLVIHLHSNGTVSFQGATISLDDLKTKLEVIGNVTPDQPIIIKAGEAVPYDKVRQIVGICHDAGFLNVTYPARSKPSAPAPSPEVLAPTAPSPVLRVPDTTTNAPPASPASPVQETPTLTIP